ncbi:hypothetical protein BDW02DRAFT_573637 [Decorospora gaudefroyi]|uniref:Yeast cell wall synthesis Kre9/Knh1-like N-terminal domain-containing protein n=1 Tax=Decorospora gaudefroyi TaxID=184978 RepID=A0A6A5K5T9_9PLEO|nr:hypothetical protein BDW02DRAFT_573637 [Decorospora gaudefroyi]
MRFFETILSSAALIAAVAALTIDEYPVGGVVAGETYTITYSPADDVPTTFVLRQGDSDDLDTIGTLTTTATGGTFEWTPSTDLVNEDDYALMIMRGDEVNYSALFPLTGGAEEDDEEVVSSTMSSASSAASSAVSSSASAADSSAMTTMSSSAASASITPSAGVNSTITSATLSMSATATTSKLPEISDGAANALVGKPMGAMFGAAALFAFLA